MKRTTFALCLAALLTLLSVQVPAPAAGGKAALKESDAFFGKTPVVEITIELDAKDADSLRREPRKYVRVTVKEGGTTYKDVGMHLKGAAGSSRGFDDKPGLTLNMNKFGEEQLFHGMDKVHLSNSVQDPSYLSELICGDLFRAAGVPASRIGHAVVTLNGKKRGLYYLKEGYDKNFLRRHFNNSDGNLYDGGFLQDVDKPLQVLFSKDAAKNHVDLKGLAAAAQEKNLNERFTKLEKLLDMDRFITYLALETITWDWDGYPMNRNNYRIYHDSARDKLVFIPSGMDQMFGNLDGPLFPNYQGLIARSVLETPEGKKRYLARMAQIMTDVFKVDALLKRLDELEARVQPALAGVDAGAGRDYKNQVNRLRNAIRERPKKIEAQLKALPKP